MYDGHFTAVLRHLQRAGAGPETEARTDRQLLDQFARHGNDQAFAQVVRRHGALVLGVCWRVLRQSQDAEDAFQATFLVLARKAGAIRWHDSVGSWLHAVAYRLAQKARADAVRREKKERKAADMSSRSPLPRTALENLSVVVDEELHQLPAVYRAPLLLCYLEGQGRDQAATHLGCSRRTLQRRLEQGLARLRGRLSRRGVTLSAALLTAALAQQSATAQVSIPLTARTVTAAAGFAAGQAPSALVGCSVQGLTLAQRMLRSLALARLRILLVLVLTLGLAGGAGLLAYPQTEPAPAPPAQPPPATPRQAATTPVPSDRYGDPLPKHALARMGTVRLRHGGPVTSIAFAPDGKTVVSAGQDNSVRLWDLGTGKERGHFEAFTGPEGANCWVVSVGLSPDGYYVVAGTSNGPGAVIVWDRATGKEFRRFDRSERIVGVAFLPDGKTVLSVGGDGTVHLWDLHAGKEIRTIAGNQSIARCFALSADGKTVATGGDDNVIQVHDLATGKELHQLQSAGESLHALAFSPDGKSLASGGWRGSLRLWDLSSGKEVRQYQGHGGAVSALVFSADGTTLVSSSWDTSVRLWDVPSGKERRDFLGHFGPVIALALSPDQKTIATGSWDATLRLWDRDTLKERIATGGHHHAVFAAAVSPDGKTLASAGVAASTGNGENFIRLWDVASGQETGRLRAARPSGWGPLVFSPDGKYLVCGRNWLQVWDLASGKRLPQFGGSEPPGTPPGLSRATHGGVLQVAVAPDGKTLVEGNIDGKVYVWDLAMGKPLRQFQAHKEMVTALALSPDGKRLATTTQDRTGTLVLWDLATGKAIHRLQAENDILGVLAFSPDGHVLVSAGLNTRNGGNSPVEFWDPAQGKKVRRSEGLPGIGCVAFSRDGKNLAVPTGHGIVVWEVATGRERCGFEGHKGSVSALAFTRDGRRLCSASQDTTLLVWDMTGGTGQRLAAGELEARWTDLASDEADRAHRALWALALASEQAVPFLQERLKPVVAVDSEKVAARIRALDSTQFAERKRAAEELAQLGPAIESELRNALKTQPRLEVRRRIDELLAALQPDKSAERRRELRAVEALEHCQTPAAVQLLEKLSRGLPEARLSQEAQAALRRLGSAS
jgi:RNA polymerase sigma factor (sigma-70 family)